MYQTLDNGGGGLHSILKVPRTHIFLGASILITVGFIYFHFMIVLFSLLSNKSINLNFSHYLQKLWLLKTDR